jgi:hypothetical protein
MESSAPVAFSDDRIRERELFRFYRPQDANAEHAPAHDNQLLLPSSTVIGPPVSTDPTLTALAQLVSLRLNIQRCILRFAIHILLTCLLFLVKLIPL